MSKRLRDLTTRRYYIHVTFTFTLNKVLKHNYKDKNKSFRPRITDKDKALCDSKAFTKTVVYGQRQEQRCSETHVSSGFQFSPE